MLLCDFYTVQTLVGLYCSDLVDQGECRDRILIHYVMPGDKNQRGMIVIVYIAPENDETCFYLFLEL